MLYIETCIFDRKPRRANCAPAITGGDSLS